MKDLFVYFPVMMTDSKMTLHDLRLDNHVGAFIFQEAQCQPAPHPGAINMVDPEPGSISVMYLNIVGAYVMQVEEFKGPLCSFVKSCCYPLDALSKYEDLVDLVILNYREQILV
jgi:hypothetical protein